MEDAANRLESSALTDQLTDPSVIELAQKCEELLQIFENEIDKTVVWASIEKNLQEDGQIITTPEDEVLDDLLLAQQAEKIAAAALTAQELSLDSRLGILNDLSEITSLPRFRKHIASMVGSPTTLLSHVALRVGLLNSPQVGLEKTDKSNISRWVGWGPMDTVEGAISRVIEENLDQPEGYPPLVTARVRNILKPVNELNRLLNDETALADMSATELGQLLQDLPTPSTLDYLAMRAYGTTMNFLGHKVKGQTKQSVGVLVPEMRQKMVDELGMTPEAVIAYEAALILGVPHAATKEADDSNEDLGRRMVLSKALGFKNGLKGIMSVTFADDLSTSCFTPDYAKPALAAQETIEELLAVADTAGRDFVSDKSVRTHNLNKVLRTTRNLFEEGRNRFYYDVDTVVRAEDASPTTVAEILELEQRMTERVAIYVDELRQHRAINGGVVNELAALWAPRMKEFITEADIQSQLQEIKAFTDALQEQINEIDKPYRYTAKGIRTYEGGLNLLKSVNEALDKRDLLPEDEIRQTLAMLVLQSENASDPAVYFEQLKTDRHAIERMLGEMNYFGVNGEADLVNVLRWIDEMIDAGLENSVSHTRFRQFIQDYYLGVEKNAPQVTETEPAPPQPEDLPLSDAEPEAEAAEPRGEPKPSAAEASEEYLNYFADVLQNVEVEFSDVAFFTAPGRSKGHEVTEGAQTPRGERFIDIDKRRLEGLVALKADFEHEGKSARLIFTAPTESKRIPYIALYVQEQRGDSTGVCFLENVEHGTATYAFAVDGTLIQNWDDLHDFSRPEWRDDWGAKPMVHPDKASNQFMKHYTFNMKQYALLKLAQVNQ